MTDEDVMTDEMSQRIADYHAKGRALRARISRAHTGKNSRVMYCVRVQLTLIGSPEPEWYYLRFRPHGMGRGYSPWTQDPREAKLWFYKSWPYHWLNIANPHLTGEVLCLHRDDEVRNAQKGMR